VSKNVRNILIGLGAVVGVFIVVQFFSDRGKSDSTTSNASATNQSTAVWVNDICTSFASWRHAVTAEIPNIKANPSRGNINDWLDNAKHSTQQLTQSLAESGAPSTAAGQQAKSTLHTLQSELKADVTVIRDAVAGWTNAAGTVEALATISTALVSMRNELKASGDALRALPGGEFEQAIASSPACADLRTPISSTG